MTRRARIVVQAAVVLLSLFVLVAGGVVALTQTQRGRDAILRSIHPMLSASMPGQLYVGRVSGNLFTDVHIDSLEIREPNGRLFLTTGPIRIVYDLRDLIDRRVVIKEMEIRRPYIHVIDYGADDWNWKRALLRPATGPQLPDREGALGKYVVIESLTVRDAHLLATQPWVLSDTLRGAKRDSALRYNLTRMDAEIDEEDGRYVRRWRFVHGDIVTGRVRIADPDSAGLKAEVLYGDVNWVTPPFWFRNVRGTVRQLGDSLWMDDVTLELTNSRGRGNAKVVWGGGKPVRYDFRIQGDSVSLIDLAWIDEAIPRSGHTRMDLHIRNDPRNLNVIDYVITDMNARSMNSHLTGNMTFGVGGPVLRVTDVDLELQPAHTDLLRHFNGEQFPYDWQGEVRGHVTARGGPVHRFQLDNATLSYHDAHVPGAVSSGRATGMLNIYTPAEAVLYGVDVDVERLDLRTPRFVNPLFPELNGIVRGYTRLDSLWYIGTFTNAQMEHVDGPGLPSSVAGNGRYALLPEGVWFDVDVQAAPLSYTTLSRSYPGLPLRGTAVGRIRAEGMVEDFSLNAILAGEGGELTFDGRVDAFEPSYRVSGDYRVRGANLQALFQRSDLPVSNLALSGKIDVDGADRATMRGPLSITLDQFSRVGDARVFATSAGARFDSGLVYIDSLNVESSVLRFRAAGGLGLVADRSDSLNFVLLVDSLGGLRPIIAPDGNSGLLPTNTDTLRGSVEVRGVLAGTVDTSAASSAGLQLRATADASEVAVATHRFARTQVEFDVAQILRGGTGVVRITTDSARVGVIDVAEGTATARLVRGLAERFDAHMTTPDDARIAVGGGMSRVGDTATVVVDTMSLMLTHDGSARGFSLATPAVAHIVNDTTGRLDSLVLVHSDAGRIALRGGIIANSGISGRLEVDRAPLYDLGRILHARTVRGGTVSLDMLIGGTRETPRLEGHAQLADADISGVRLDTVNVNARYDSLRLGFDAALTVAGRRALDATGSLPLDLALVAGRTRRLDAPLSGRLVSRDADLSLLETVFPTVQDASGLLQTDIALTGTWHNPRLSGALSVADGALSLDNLGIRLQQANADIRLAGDTVHVRTLRAASGGPSDTIAITGRIGIADATNPFFDLRLSSRNFLAIDKPRQASLFVTTTQPITLFGPQNGAVVRGAARIDQGRLYVRALTQRRGLDLTDDFDVIDTVTSGVNSLLPEAPAALLQNLSLDNVTVEVGEDVWLRSPEANIKLGGALRVTRSISRDRGRPVLALSDSLTVERGTYTLNLGIVRPVFEVERGLIRFFGDPDLEPALDITALHTVRELRPNSNRQDVRIRVSIGGTTAQPTLTLSSADNPPLPESDMLSYLVTGEPAYALLGTPYADQGLTLVLRYASSRLSSRLAGGRFDVVQVEPTALAPGETQNLGEDLLQTRVGVGGQIARNTYLTLSTALCGFSQQAAGDPLSLFAQGIGLRVERRFERGLSISAGVEPASSALACGRPGSSRTFQQTPPQIGFDLFRSWTF